MLSEDLVAVVGSYTLGASCSLLTGYVVRYFGNPTEMRRLREEIEALSSQMPSKRDRALFPKLDKKARKLQSQLSLLRRRHFNLAMKRAFLVAGVYVLGFVIAIMFLPPVVSSPVHIPMLTGIAEGGPYIPTLFLYIFVLFVLSPLTQRIVEQS
ncbi:MAG: hypothetical protein QXU97_01860 [Fervidicoccaceae archaeon]